MSTLSTLKINLDKIDKTKIFQGTKGRYLEITIAHNDEADQYGNDTSAWIGQTKEEREAGDSKIYIGNGKQFWTDGKASTKQHQEDAGDLPF